LTKEQIKAGYSALQSIASCVEKADFGSHLTAACNDFYTRIPHYFGFAHSFILPADVVESYHSVFRSYEYSNKDLPNFN